MTTALRVLYALGPGDAVSSYRHWKTGADLLSETSRTFSGQFFDFCRRAGHSCYAISSFAKAEKLVDGPMMVENRPKRFSGSGLRYHVSQALYGMSIMLSAIRWRADVVIVEGGTTHWALLAPLKLAGMTLMGTLHNVPWPHGYRPKSGYRRFLLASDGWFWRRIASAVICVSPECERQVRELAGELTAVTAQFRAQFNRRDFAAVCRPPPSTRTPFRVTFAGRIERNKGVFDILEIARLLELERPGRVRFDICGGGPAFEALNDSVHRQGLAGVLRTHGKLARPALLQVYAACHAVIVPTRSDFGEGMPMVCAEAILCGRPVITSRLSNAADVLPGALVIARPDEPASYAEAIRALLDDSDRYERLCAACAGVQEQFYDPRRSLTAALETVFSALAGQARQPA